MSRIGLNRASPFLIAFLMGCSDSTGPGREGRALGILQFEGATSAAIEVASPGIVAAGSGAAGDGPIRWSLPPGEFSFFPPEVIEAPRTAIVGEPFGVTTYTVGPNGCWSVDGLEVSRSGRVIELTPWDRHSEAEVCTMIFGYLAHPTTLQLDEVGEWTLRVRGRRVRGDDRVDDSVTAERTVLVVENHPSEPALEIELGVGEEIRVDGVFRIAFVEVTEDSRCPVDVVCVWEGNGAAVLGLSLGSGPTYPSTVNTVLEPRSADHGGYRVTLLELHPTPVSTSSIPPTSYRARLHVEGELP